MLGGRRMDHGTARLCGRRRLVGRYPAPARNAARLEHRDRMRGWGPLRSPSQPDSLTPSQDSLSARARVHDGFRALDDVDSRGFEARGHRTAYLQRKLLHGMAGDHGGERPAALDDDPELGSDRGQLHDMPRETVERAVSGV